MVRPRARGDVAHAVHFSTDISSGAEETEMVPVASQTLMLTDNVYPACCSCGAKVTFTHTMSASSTVLPTKTETGDDCGALEY